MSVKLLYIPLQTSTPETDDLYQAFRKECEVFFWKVSEFRSPNHPIGFKPDIVYVHSGALSLDTLQYVKENTKAVWAQWTGDCIENQLLEPVISYKGLFDYTFLSCGIGQKEIYEKALGHHVHWLPHAVADWQFRAVKDDAEGIVFVGNNYDHFSGSKERQELNRILSNRTDFRLYGSGWGDHVKRKEWKDLPDTYNRAYIGIGANNINSVELYFSNRPLNIMAAGCLHLMRRVPGIERFFEHKEDCLLYDTNEEALKLIEEMENEREQRNYIAGNGQKLMEDYFMYDNIVIQFLETVK